MVSPASADGAVPENVSALPRMPEAVVCRVMPPPVVETVTSPLCTLGAGAVVLPVVVPLVVPVVAVVLATGAPPGRPAPPPDDASAAAGTASAAVSNAETA